LVKPIEEHKWNWQKESFMKVTDFLHKYKKVLNTRIEDISISLTSGNASDMEAYKAMVGEIQGLTYALEQLRTLLEKVDNDIDSA
jgi:hypothetical protein